MALGIDYAQAAVAVAHEALAPQDRVEVARMDATRLALRSNAFDVAFMLDFVEHVYQPELERAFAETARALRPGGRLIIHTSPNRLFEERVWPRYVRNVHRALLGAAKRLGLRNRFFNRWLLPTDAIPPHDEYERRLHVNPQSGASLRDALAHNGFHVRRLDYWEPPHERFFPANERALNAGLALLDAVRFLRPVSHLPPLNRLFSNHVWVVAERR
jgi:SAM-dependent methyltransferase